MADPEQPTVVFDINVVLDVLQRRKPFYDASAALWAAAEGGKYRSAPGNGFWEYGQIGRGRVSAVLNLARSLTCGVRSGIM
jgi:hypothetical protein